MRSTTLFFLLTFFTAHLDAFAGHRDAIQAFPPRMQQILAYVAADTPGNHFISLKSIKAAGKKCAEQALGHAPSEKEMHAWWQQPEVLPTQQAPLAALAPFKKPVPLAHLRHTLPALAPFKKPVPLANPRYKLAMCAIFRDEARFLKEWIEYYLMLGVEHFYLLNHMSKDNPEAVLQPYIERGLVTLTYEMRAPQAGQSHIPYQIEFYKRTNEQVENTVEWLACFDIDEYLVPLQDDNIVQLLERYPDYAAVSFNWVVFGTGGVQGVPGDKLMIETLNKRSHRMHGAFKTIRRPRCMADTRSAHRPFLQVGFMWCHEDKKLLCWNDKNCTPPQRPQVAHINHYYLKDRDFIATKKTRVHCGKKSKEEWDKIDAEYSAVEDTTIHRFVPELRRRMGFDTSTATA